MPTWAISSKEAHCSSERKGVCKEQPAFAPALGCWLCSDPSAKDGDASFILGNDSV